MGTWALRPAHCPSQRPVQVKHHLPQYLRRPDGLGGSLPPFVVIAEDLATGSKGHVLPEYRQHLDGARIVYPGSRNISAAARTLADFMTTKLTSRLSE